MTSGFILGDAGQDAYCTDRRRPFNIVRQLTWKKDLACGSIHEVRGLELVTTA